MSLSPKASESYNIKGVQTLTEPWTEVNSYSKAVYGVLKVKYSQQKTKRKMFFLITTYSTHHGRFFWQSNVLKTQIMKQCLQTFEFWEWNILYTNPVNAF